MRMNLTKLTTALILTSTLVGCAAIVKSPYQAPHVDIPQGFQNSQQMGQQIHQQAFLDQWWT